MQKQTLIIQSKHPIIYFSLHSPLNIFFIYMYLCLRKWSSKQLFSKFNPSPSPVATVKPQVQNISQQPDAPSKVTTRSTSSTAGARAQSGFKENELASAGRLTRRSALMERQNGEDHEEVDKKVPVFIKG